MSGTEIDLKLAAQQAGDFEPEQKRYLEGFVAGLQIAKLSMNRVENSEEFVREFSDDDRLIVDYLMDEVLSRQPQEIQRFLAATALSRYWSLTLSQRKINCF